MNRPIKTPLFRTDCRYALEYNGVPAGSNVATKWNILTEDRSNCPVTFATRTAAEKYLQTRAKYYGNLPSSYRVAEVPL